MGLVKHTADILYPPTEATGKPVRLRCEVYQAADVEAELKRLNDSYDADMKEYINQLTASQADVERLKGENDTLSELAKERREERDRLLTKLKEHGIHE